MRISAIVPAHNAAASLERAVLSLIDTNCEDLEIVVVDDGSRDDTLRVAERLRERHPGIVSVLANGVNLGVSVSRNRGIAASTGDLVCFLDADDYVYPHRFDTAVRLLADDPEIDAVHELAGMVFENSSERDNWVDDSDIFGLGDVPRQSVLEVLLRGGCWHTSAFLFRRSLLRRTGVFDEGLRIAEDCHLWFRMACAGCIGAGDMRAPVSAYVRHGNNTYANRIEHKIDMVVAMGRAYQWALRHDATASVRALFVRSIRDYLHNAVIVAREAGRPDVSRRLITAALQLGRPELVWDARLARQVPHVALESLGRRHPPARGR